MIVIMAKHFSFSLIRPQDMCPNTRISGPVSSCQLHFWLFFLCFFWSNGFLLAQWSFNPCFIVETDTVLTSSASIFKRSLAGIRLHTAGQNTLISGTHRTHLVPERNGWTFLYLIWTNERCNFRKIFPWTNQTGVAPYLGRFSFWLSHSVKQESSEIQVWPWNAWKCVPPINSNVWV